MRPVVAVIPAHDEAETIRDVVVRTLAHVDRAIVVDDGSRDATADLAEAAGALVVRLSPNVGKGQALVIGLARATELGAEIVVTLDADGEHDPDDLPRLVAALDTADVALGARHVYRTGVRRAANALALVWFRLLDPSIDDTICGFRAFRRAALPIVHNDAGGFVYEHEVILRAVEAGLRLASVPVATEPRARSHVSPREIVRANNHFDRWVLARLGALGLPAWKKAVLALACVAGLAVGVPAAWTLDARGGR